MRWPWQRLLASKHTDPVPDGKFRLQMLDDNPWPTYIGTRAWCDGKPYWDDKTCKCTHTERNDQ